MKATTTKTPTTLTELLDKVLALQAANDELRDEKAYLERANAALAEQHEQLEREYAQLEVAQGFAVEIVRGSDEEQSYWASNRRRHFHRPGCTWGEYVPSYKRIEFSSHREAVEAGYKPCKTCRA